MGFCGWEPEPMSGPIGPRTLSAAGEKYAADGPLFDCQEDSNTSQGPPVERASNQRYLLFFLSICVGKDPAPPSFAFSLFEGRCCHRLGVNKKSDRETAASGPAVLNCSAGFFGKKSLVRRWLEGKMPGFSSKRSKGRS